MTDRRPRLALDENFLGIVLDAGSLVPELDIARLRDIDRRLLGLSDRRLIIALHQLGWDGLITNNYKMLNVPGEIAAVLRTKLTVAAVRGVGDDPVRATGSLLLDLPAIARSMVRGDAVEWSTSGTRADRSPTTHGSTSGRLPNVDHRCLRSCTTRSRCRTRS